ncbi:E3 ubiquitin-protein ligase arkadia [Rhynchospora pubera]|uniref:E3 ubiquitin-protein ligase arkadia n=1 Tax=Rhynchospora pubera TaxID=906938 RepID=A0AAV8CFZ9_9POAL|nr:E3 ubiquitin-protein ligase arkadia [Rhynchospora pubera]KAJ4793259.1 E3 ubiquitin-protein ligase arkadia [Rhynchospora pubera]
MNLDTFAIIFLFLPCFLLLIIISEAVTRFVTRVMQMHARSHFDWPQDSLFSREGHVAPKPSLFQQCKQQLCVKQYKCGTGQHWEPERCVFCLSDVSDGEEIRELRCRHIFHRACLDTWLEHRWATCPICRDCLLPTEEKASSAAVTDMNDDEIEDMGIAFVSYYRPSWWMW